MTFENPDINDAAKRITELSEPKGFGGLSESLYQFAGTPLEDLLKRKFEENGIDPKTYNTHKDLNYIGLPMSNGESEALIITLVDDEINQGNIFAIPQPIARLRETGNDRWNSVHDMPRSAHQMRYAPQGPSRISKITSGISNEVLIDANTHEIVGYTLDLEGDGGTKGYALASSDIVELVSQDTGEVLTGEAILKLEEARRVRVGESPLSEG